MAAYSHFDFVTTMWDSLYNKRSPPVRSLRRLSGSHSPGLASNQSTMSRGNAASVLALTMTIGGTFDNAVFRHRLPISTIIFGATLQH
jgi:hypothetical protein